MEVQVRLSNRCTHIMRLKAKRPRKLGLFVLIFNLLGMGMLELGYITRTSVACILPFALW